MTDLVRSAVYVCVVAGPALWLSRASLDRIGTGTGTRVAFLPSLPELAGLTVTVGLLLFLAGTLAVRWLQQRRPDQVPDARGLWPLAVVALVALPFLPWLPDMIPAIEVLAGPARWWLWGVALGLTAWAIAGDRVRVPPSRWSWVGVLLASAVLSGAAAFRLAPSALFPGGDEPHYLVITQSLLADGDFAIQNNHDRGDYRDYFAGELKPDYIARGRGGTVYSIHPIGLPMLVAPAFALGGYRGASLLVVACAALAMALLWRLVWLETGSGSAATMGWMAIATSAPWLLHSFALYPEVPAALAVLVAIGWRRARTDAMSSIVRGLSIAVLPWLSTKYAPMSAALIVVVCLRRGEGARANRLMPAVLWAASVAAWLAWFAWLWGSPWPSAPYGDSHQMAVSHLIAGVPGVLFDQEYGAIAYAPLLALALPGWWRLWRDGRRETVLGSLVPFVVLLVTVSAYAMFWGGSAPPGRQVVAALPLLGVPVATLYSSTDEQPVQRAFMVLLLLAGVMISATVVLASGGLLIANGRDGSAAWLEYLSPAGELVRLAPSLIRGRTEPLPAWLTLTLWALAAAAVWAAASRGTANHRGPAALSAAGLVAGGLLVVAVAVPAVARPLPPRAPIESRAVIPALMRYDATARPWAIDYRPFRIVAPEAILPLFVLEGRAGLRHDRQPLRVLLNMRLALPPGRYRVTLTPASGHALNGHVGLQVGRLGRPLETWPLDGGPEGEWQREFELDLEAAFVGLRGVPELEDAIRRLRVQPLSVLDAGRRPRRPPVVAAAKYGGRPFYFHDENAYLEPSGFWVRGERRLSATAVIGPGPEPPGLQLQLHSGSGTTDVALATALWSTTVALSPGSPVPVLVPALPQQHILSLTIAPDAGFVPAEHGGPPADRRLLGCWVEVLPR